MFQPVIAVKEKLIQSSRLKIRERAISRAKSKIALEGKTLSDYTPEQVEDIVAEEERDLISKMKEKSLLALIAFLGFGAI